MVWYSKVKKNFEDIFSRFDRIPACDRRMDGQTFCDRNSALCIASHGKNARKTSGWFRGTVVVTFCDSTLNTANLCPAISVVGLFYLLTVIMNFVCRFILGVDFTRRFRFCMYA